MSDEKQTDQPQSDAVPQTEPKVEAPKDEQPAQEPPPLPRDEPQWEDVGFPRLGGVVLPISELFRNMRRRRARAIDPRVIMITELARAAKANAEAVKSVADAISLGGVNDGSTHITIDRDVVEDVSRELRKAAVGFIRGFEVMSQVMQDHTGKDGAAPAPDQPEGPTGPTGGPGAEGAEPEGDGI